MPTPKWEKIKTEAEKFDAVLEDNADEQIDKLKKSRFTWLILAGVAALVVLAWLMG